MQAIPSFSPPQSLQHFSDDHFQFSTVDKVSDDVTAQLQLTPDDDNNTEKSSQIEEQEDENEGEGEEEDKNEDEFSFTTNSDKSAISADDVFHDGQIRPIFPLFNRDLLFSDHDYHSSSSEFPPRSPVKVFVEAPPHPSSSSSETDKNDGVAEGPYCAWSKKPTEASPDGCKKSNSTGFSKLWRFRDYLDRSNSDGRDAFVFLNNSTVSAKREDKIAGKSDSSSKKKKAGEISSEKKPAGEVKVGGGKAGKVINKKGGVKGKTASLSAHEVYMRNRGSQEDDRRRSYLPYRPELVGFFTNVNGGLSRNVHPF